MKQLINFEDFKLLSDEEKYNLLLQYSGETVSNATPLVKGTEERGERIFSAKIIADCTRNLIIGSSIVARIKHNMLPEDVQIHSYSGSFTNEKREVVRQYPAKKLKSITIQDGTNAILNSSKSTDELFQDYELLVNEIQRKFNPDTVYLCEVTPLQSYKEGEKSKICDFNAKIKELCNDNNLTLIPLYECISNIPNFETLLFYNRLHFQDPTGVNVLTDLIKQKVLSSSNNVPRINSPDRKPQKLNANNSRFHPYVNVQNQVNKPRNLPRQQPHAFLRPPMNSNANYTQPRNPFKRNVLGQRNYHNYQHYDYTAQMYPFMNNMTQF